MADKQMVLKTTQSYIEKLMEQSAPALPQDLNRARFRENAMTVLKDTKGIENCEPASIARTIMKGAFLGLDFFQKECYAIPYKNTLQFQTDYKGETKLAKKYSIRPIMDIYAKVVRHGDVFEEEIIQGKQSINFKPLPFNNEPIIGAFAVVLYKDGGMEYETMSTEQIEGIRNQFSKMANGLMWTKTPEEAYKKTVLRRLTKKIEKDFSANQIEIFEEGSGMEFENKNEPQQPVETPDPFAETKANAVDVEIIEPEFLKEDDSDVKA